MQSLFLLDPEVAYLNHGSFGACPKSIFDDYQKWQRELEAEPVQFITKNSLGYLQESKQALATFAGCGADDFVFTPNPTFAVNVIMRSLDLQPGDEILATDHEYGAMDRTWNFYTKKTGAKYVRANVTLPIVSKAQILEQFWKGYSAKTKVVFLNHMSSATALLFPVKEIVDKARALGLITIVDGAHIPGHIDLNIAELDPDFYTGTAHKWLLTPKGSSFLYVAKRYQSMLDPLVVSWGYESAAPGDSQFLDYHEHQGTRDISAYLTLPAALKFRKDHDWESAIAQSKKMILDHYQEFCDLLGTQPICPITPDFLGQMCSVPVRTHNPAALKELLFDRYRIEIPVMTLGVHTYIRISLNGYNTANDLNRLKSALTEIKQTTDLIQ
ncbi:aminotransferase class V-fold PLP-dependent enzyme [Flavobacterium caeni]|uniref:Isopenicillin-N epimerase n=1 Tax=Flavobacterium caeni TaxID=490189 RepID=A0A1G5JVV5_9FLAO|nr:aminotransferase class V-fold PLP-dependent enzyme [Flavobacterium caeni]SCY91908.1 isopenicillin-N epimerase [Flavobacterium caeni]